MASRSANLLLATLGDALWRADALADAFAGATLAPGAQGAVVPSGHPALDAQLPGGGWPVGALCEVLQPPGQHHEWRLLLPALCAVSGTAGATGRVVLVGAPLTPFGPGLAGQGLDAASLLWVQADALAQRLWAAEQVLRCAGVAALLLWLAPVRGEQVRTEHLRRLHLAALAHSKLLFVMRAQAVQGEASPAVLRLLLGAPPSSSAPGALNRQGADALAVYLFKRRGAPLAQWLPLSPRPAALALLLSLAGAGKPTPLVSSHVLDRFATAV